MILNDLPKTWPIKFGVTTRTLSLHLNSKAVPTPVRQEFQVLGRYKNI